MRVRFWVFCGGICMIQSFVGSIEVDIGVLEWGGQDFGVGEGGRSCVRVFGEEEEGIQNWSWK